MVGHGGVSDPRVNFRSDIRTVLLERHHILLGFLSWEHVSLVFLALREKCTCGGVPQS